MSISGEKIRRHNGSPSQDSYPGGLSACATPVSVSDSDAASTTATTNAATNTAATGPWLQVPMCATPVSKLSYSADDDLEPNGTSLSGTSSTSDMLDPNLYDYGTSVSSVATSPPSVDVYLGSLLSWASPDPSASLGSSGLSRGGGASTASSSASSSCAAPTSSLSSIGGADALLYEPYVGDLSDFTEYPRYPDAEDSSVWSPQSHMLWPDSGEKAPYTHSLPMSLDISL